MQSKQGFQRMLDVLADCAKALSQREVRGAMLAASRPVEQAARRNLRAVLRENRSATRRPAGRAPGGLRESMKGANIRVFRSRGGRHSLVVGPRWPIGAHGTLLEFGTHRQKPRPFLRPAWDAHRTRVARTLRDEIARRIAKRAKKARRA